MTVQAAAAPGREIARSVEEAKGRLQHEKVDGDVKRLFGASDCGNIRYGG